MTPSQLNALNQAHGADPLAEQSAEELLLNSELAVEALQQDLDAALTKADANWHQYLAAHAEMENLRKRTERDIQNAHKFALERFVNELLPVRDSLEMGLAAADNTTEVAQLREGIELTLKQLASAMEKFGVQQLNPQGEKFDHNLHEAMATAPIPGVEANTVLQVVQKGYVLNERLIRSAKVIVAAAPANP